MSTGALKPREDTKLYGTSKESQLLNPSSPFFKSFPVECSRSQVACDMLVFGGQYADLATLSKAHPSLRRPIPLYSLTFFKPT